MALYDCLCRGPIALNEWLRLKIPRRAILGILMFLACMFSYFIRTNLSITIVAMVKSDKGGPKKEAYCTELLHQSNNITYVPKNISDFGERYEWNERIQGFILASYFVGPVLASVPAGMAAERFGGARVVAWATLIPAVLNLLTPLAAGLHWSVVMILRFLMGFSGCAVYPALHAMIARWVPPQEKGMFVWTMQGGPFGTFVTLSLCGAVISAFGWKAAFYTTSGLMLVFYVLWVWLAYDTPDDHPTITQEEKTYIKEKIGTSVSKQKVSLPLRHMVTSLPFLALIYAHFANMWGIYFISTNGPKYSLEVLGFNMKKGGFLTGLPYIARLGAGVLFAAGGDFLRRREIIKLVWIRKLFMIFSHVGPGLALLITTYVGCDRSTAIVMIIGALALNGAACQTSLQNHQDLAPNYAGSLYGVMNTIGSFPGFIIPPVVGALIYEQSGVYQWRIMFWISAIVFFSATALFWIFGSASIQRWNDLNANPDTVTNGVTKDEEKQLNDLAKAPVQSETEDENEKL
ncbi:sialin isoform X1 [Diachasma alloeum]|uniref:sialin isoform X1 n=2 Tax=Diachasma alloeum TaxID=454923 RepID=UPI000738460D|nr:sialin isoform X1 [Diachasma alloeum]XP_015123385.1 sialin isoform X1 [Diachasma alloeum]